MKTIQIKATKEEKLLNYALFEIGFIDILCTLGILYFSVKKGKKSFEKVKGMHAFNYGCK